MGFVQFKIKILFILFIIYYLLLFQVAKSRSSRKQLHTPPPLAEERKRMTNKGELGGGNYYLVGKNISGAGFLTEESK